LASRNARRVRYRTSAPVAPIPPRRSPARSGPAHAAWCRNCLLRRAAIRYPPLPRAIRRRGQFRPRPPSPPPARSA